MIQFAVAETPEEIQHQEDWINRTLSPDYPGVHVCLHADRTVTMTDDVPPWIRTECDYCPAFVITRITETVVLVPSYFSIVG
jgi:hypothetical protein